MISWPALLLSAVMFVVPLFGAGELPAVAVRFSEGKVHERPLADTSELVKENLYPGRPMLQPLPDASLEHFQEFYYAETPRFDVTSQQLTDLDRRAANNPAVRRKLDTFLEHARRLVNTPLPEYEPSQYHWLNASTDVIERVEATAALLARIRRVSALAFAITGDEIFAEKAWEAFKVYMNHFYKYGVFRMPYSADSPWDSAHELYDGLACYDLIAHWEGLHPLNHALIFSYVRRLGRRVAYAVQHSPVIGTQQTAWTSHLGCAAEYASSLPEAHRWRRLVQNRLNNVMADYTADGGHVECSLRAHIQALKYLTRYAKVMNRQGDDELLHRGWRNGRVSIQRAFDWLARIVTPLGHIPAVNDSHRQPLYRYSQFVWAANTYHRSDWVTAGRLRQMPPQLLVAVDEDIRNAAPTTPEYRSTLLRQTGFAVMRDGWDEDDHYLLFDYGRHGGSHGHLDKLNFVMYADGQPWVLDAGPAPNIAIHSKQQERWHRRTVAHNTVLVERSSQKATEGKLITYSSRPEFDLVTAEHSGYDKFVHRRTVFHPRGEYFLIFDELKNTADRKRHLQWLLHVAGRRESGTSGRFVFWRPNDYGLAVLYAKGHGLRGAKIDRGLCLGLGNSDTMACTIAPAQADPCKPGDRGWGYIPYIGLKNKVAPNASRIYCVALVPFHGQEPVVKMDVNEEPGAYGITVSRQKLTDRILIRRRGVSPGHVAAVGLTTDGKFAFMRQRDGNTEMMDWVGRPGTSLSVSGAITSEGRR